MALTGFVLLNGMRSCGKAQKKASKWTLGKDFFVKLNYSGITTLHICLYSYSTKYEVDVCAK